MEMPLGKYSLKNSFLHRLDARFKLLAMILLMITVFVPFVNRYMDFTYYGVLLVACFIMMKIASIKIKSLFNMMKPMTFMILFILIVNLFVVKTGTPIEFFSWTIYADAIYNTLYTFLRLVLMISLSLILTSTTKPMDLTYALEWYMFPLKLIKVPVHIIAMIISLALRFIPTLLEETDRIMKAQASRGVDFVNGKFKEKVRAITSLIIPLFVSSIQRSVELAEAMEARGYDPDAKRTRYRVMKFRKIDFLSFVVVVLLFVSIILAIIFKVDIYKGVK